MPSWVRSLARAASLLGVGLLATTQPPDGDPFTVLTLSVMIVWGAVVGWGGVGSSSGGGDR